LINYQVERAIKAGVAKFRFHDYRHTALTRWAREKIHVDVAMVAAGHSSVQMHQRYTHLQDKDIAAAFDCGKNVVTHSVTRRRIARRK
jgi:integrase